MSIQTCIENVKNQKMEQYIRGGDINDINMELINITNKLIKSKSNKCIYVSKTFYYIHFVFLDNFNIFNNMTIIRKFKC